MNRWFELPGNLINRIPPSVMAILLGIIAAYFYLRLQKDEPAVAFLKEKMWDFLIVFALVTRFSVLILHPSLFWHLNIYYILAQPPTEGWLVGLTAAVLVGARSWIKAKVDNGTALYQLAHAFLWGSMPYFLYLSLVAGVLFRWLALGRFTWTIIIAIAIRSERLRRLAERYPQRLWGLIGLGLLLSSLTVPSVDLLGPLTVAQWAELSLCLAALIMEAYLDIVGSKTSAVDP